MRKMFYFAANLPLLHCMQTLSRITKSVTKQVNQQNNKTGSISTNMY